MKARLFAPENRKWWTLTAVSFGLFMIMLDNTVVNVALPSIQRSLHLKISELEWVVTGYALTFGAFMLTGGKLADLFGRRLIFVVGLAIFTGSSLACGLAGSASVLIGARVVQGLGAALMNPATLSIITVTFPPRQRGTAIGIWAGISALALAIGPLVGGLITERINWNWIFFINIPVGMHRDRRGVRVHRRVARHLARAAAGRLRPRHLGARPVRAQLRADRGEQLRLDVRPDPRRVRDRRGVARRVRPARAAPAAADARPRPLPQPDLRRREHGDAARRPRDVRRLLLRLALRAAGARLLADPGRRELPAVDGADHPARAARRAALRPRSGRGRSSPAG